jgi:hypothetical protein
MQKHTNWIGVSVNHAPRILEEISAQIFDLGCQGITELDASFELYFSENDFSEKQKELLIGLLKLPMKTGMKIGKKILRYLVSVKK